MITIEQIQDKCVQVFGLEHSNTIEIFKMCEYKDNNINIINTLLDMLIAIEQAPTDIVHIVISTRNKYNENIIFRPQIIIEMNKQIITSLSQLYNIMYKVMRDKYPYWNWNICEISLDDVVTY